MDAEIFLSPTTKGWLTVTGGFLIHIVLGSLYCWANLTSAITSRIRQFHGDVTYNDTLIIFAAALAAQGLTIFYGGFLGQKIGTPLTCLIGGYILVLGTYLSSLATSLDSMILTDGILFGIGLGICYTSPISCAVRWLPKKKGLATGIIVGGFGCGAFIFGNFATFLVNPHNKPVEKVGPNARYYDAKSEVVERVPYMFEMLAVAYFCCITVGSLLIFDPSMPSDNSSRFWIYLLPSCWTNRVSQALTKSSQPRYQVTNTTDDEVYPNPLNSQLAGEMQRSSGSPASKNAAQKYKYKEVEMMLHSSSISESAIEHSSNSDKFPEESGEVASPLAPALQAAASYDEERELDPHAAASASSPSHSRSHVDEETPDLSPKDLLELPLFWHLTSCFVTTTVGGMYVAGTFKTFGQEFFQNEAFLAQVSSVSAIFNAVGRIAWGSLADRIGPLRTLYILSFTFSLILATYSLSPLLAESGFVVWTFSLFFFEGGNFVLYVPIAVQLFGSRYSASNYGLIFSVYSIFVVLNITVLSDYKFEFTLASRLMAVLTFIGFVNLLFFGRRIAALKRTDGRLSDCKFT